MPKLYRAQYFCICEGQQEELYLDHLGALLKTPQRSVKFKHIRGTAADLKRGAPFGYDKAVLFDHDCKKARFIQQIEACDKAEKGRTNRQDPHTYHAYSNLNFDLWLALHSQAFTAFHTPVCQNNDYVDAVRKCYHLSKTADIKKESVIQKILDKITLDDVKRAIRRAEEIRARKVVTAPHRAGNTDWYDNPDFSIDQFLKKVLKDAGELL